MPFYRFLPPLILLAMLSVSIFAQEDGRLAVPDRKAVKSERNAVLKVLRQKTNLRDPAAKVVFLIRHSKHQNVVPARRFALLSLAISIAVEGQNLTAAGNAVEQLVRTFRVDYAKRGLRVVENYLKGRRSPRASSAAAEFLIEICGKALSQRDIAGARQAIARALKISKAQKLDGITKNAREIETIVKQAQRLQIKLKKAGAEKESPLDRGVYDSFVRGDLTNGMLSLAKVKEGLWGAIAAAEGKNPSAVKDLVSLADLWLKNSEKQTSNLLRAGMRGRAMQLILRAEKRGQAKEKQALALYLKSSGYLFWGKRLMLQGTKASSASDFALVQTDRFIANSGVTKGKHWKQRLPTFPNVHFSKGRRYFWNLDTNLGPMTLELFHEAAPKHCSNFVYLTRLGFFEGLKFHRIMTNFMAQGGCPTGTGTANPGYAFGGELDNGRHHDSRGILSMANIEGQPNSDSCQFFITSAKRSLLMANTVSSGASSLVKRP